MAFDVGVLGRQQRLQDGAGRWFVEAVLGRRGFRDECFFEKRDADSGRAADFMESGQGSTAAPSSFLKKTKVKKQRCQRRS